MCHRRCEGKIDFDGFMEQKTYCNLVLFAKTGLLTVLFDSSRCFRKPYLADHQTANIEQNSGAEVQCGVRPPASDWIFFQIGVLGKLNPPPNHLIMHFYSPPPRPLHLLTDWADCRGSGGRVLSRNEPRQAGGRASRAAETLQHRHVLDISVAQSGS